MKRSIKLTVKRISCLVMVCALLTSSYPIQTVAAETDVEETTPIAQADVQELFRMKQSNIRKQKKQTSHQRFQRKRSQLKIRQKLQRKKKQQN